ncbi:MAG: nuclear transport factor 2 family protein [Bryobacterales bacterium]|nr:nuclear transport factor 2 family protein [Bryobacterales bacterium]
MPVTELDQLHPAFTSAFNTGNVEALMDLYEPDAALVPSPGRTVTGSGAIREALTTLLGMKLTIEMDLHSALTGGTNLAMLRSAWRLKNGAEVAMSGQAIEVVRRGSGGVWRYVIDNPFAA